MKNIILLLPYFTLLLGATFPGKPASRKITLKQAEALVMASLSPQQRSLPKVEAEHFDNPGKTSARFLFFTVVWEGLPNGSVVVGNYAVDPYTGDVFSTTQECYEEKNKRLEALQAQLRAQLHLSPSVYQRLKTKGPLCEE